MVGVNISHSYFHPGGAHITWVKIISHTGTGNRIPDLLILRSTPYLFGHMLPFSHHSDHGFSDFEQVSVYRVPERKGYQGA